MSNVEYRSLRVCVQSIFEPNRGMPEIPDHTFYVMHVYWFDKWIYITHASSLYEPGYLWDLVYTEGQLFIGNVLFPPDVSVEIQKGIDVMISKCGAKSKCV
jgi:hypothetical protein